LLCHIATTIISSTRSTGHATVRSTALP
jgi:hypothetical protein